MAKQKIALVHDYLREYGGAERVLEALHEIYPEAPVYTAFFDEESLGIHAQRFAGWDIRETGITRLPWYKKLHSPYRIFAPYFFSKLDLSQFECVISSTNAYYAKAIQVPNGKHICYCHTPPRALYGYTTVSNWKKNPLIRVLGEVSNHFLRIIDFNIAQKVDFFIANSYETAARIRKFYKKDSIVIYPPVVVPAKLTSTKDRSYYLYVNRLALAKHPELAVKVCTEHGYPLVVVGEGKMRQALESEAGSTIRFMGAVTDGKLQELYAGAQALLYPVEDEDFGIVPVEAIGYGVPVIAHNSGGPRETVIEGKTGFLFTELTTDSLHAAMKKSLNNTLSPTALHEYAEQFSTAVFQKKINSFVKKVIEG